jgi:hypothetical protein
LGVTTTAAPVTTTIAPTTTTTPPTTTLPPPNAPKLALDDVPPAPIYDDLIEIGGTTEPRTQVFVQDRPAATNLDTGAWRAQVQLPDFGETAVVIRAVRDGVETRQVLNLTRVNRAPIARVGASTTRGASPLAVSFDASGSSDPEGQPLSFAWDLDGDGSYNDGAGPTAQRQYTTGQYSVRVRVRDSLGATATATVAITVTDPPPVVRGGSFNLGTVSGSRVCGTFTLSDQNVAVTSFRIASGPAAGEASFISGALFQYCTSVPGPRSDRFTYTVTNPQGSASATGTVTISWQ